MAPRLSPAVQYRKLQFWDRAAFEAHLVALDAESRRQRFGIEVDDAFLRHYAERCIVLNATIHGAFHGSRLIGVGELRGIVDPLGGEAELAFSVDRRFRGRGIGSALFARVLRSARNRGFGRLYLTCIPRNRAMQALARKFAANIRIDWEGGHASLDAAPRSPASLLRETLSDAAALTLQALDWQRNALRSRRQPIARGNRS